MEKGCGDARDREGNARYTSGVSLHPSPLPGTAERAWFPGTTLGMSAKKLGRVGANRSDSSRASDIPWHSTEARSFGRTVNCAVNIVSRVVNEARIITLI